MSDRLDFFFRQRVQESELDLGFELLEKADRNLAADIGVYGIISGAAPTPHSPVPDISIDLTAPARSYDNLGRRIFFGTGQTVDCSVDHAGIPTDVPSVGEERWLGIFLRFERLLSDPRMDGNSQQVFFRRDESFEVIVRQGPSAPAGTASKVPLDPQGLLVCDVRRTHGQAQILASDIDTSRRQAFVFAQGDAVEIVSALWNVLQPPVNTVQAAFNAVDSELDGHFGGTDRRHPASDIDYTPHGFVGSDNVQAGMNELVDDLSSSSAGNPGAKLIGAAAASGSPHALPQGNVDGQISQLLAWLNSHRNAASGAHAASAISASLHNYLTTQNVQAQLEELVTSLLSVSGTPGAFRIGNEPVLGSPSGLPQGTVGSQISALLTAVNARTVASALAANSPAGAGLVGAAAISGSPDSISQGTVAQQLSALLARVNERARKAGDVFTGAVTPSYSGIELGASAARWKAFLREVNATSNTFGTPGVEAFAPDANTPGIIGAGTGRGTFGQIESDGIEASHQGTWGKVWDIIKSWNYFPQHNGDIQDPSEINAVTQRNIVKAWGSVTAAGVLQNPKWNVWSVVRPTTGQYNIVLDTSPGTRNAVVATIVSNAYNARFSVHVYSPDGATIEIDTNSDGVLTDLAFTFIVIGA